MHKQRTHWLLLGLPITLLAVGPVLYAQRSHSQRERTAHLQRHLPGEWRRVGEWPVRLSITTRDSKTFVLSHEFQGKKPSTSARWQRTLRVENADSVTASGFGLAEPGSKAAVALSADGKRMSLDISDGRDAESIENWVREM